jgi:catechol 2,3-dioxygenase-like lactoylglutathione lyase family enzyme
MALRVGLRVNDVPAATRFYSGLGFEEIGRVPDPHGAPVLTILTHGETDLVVDALEGLPFPDTPREQQTQQGPRGLGVVVGLRVDDLDATYAYCTGNDCPITCEPMDEAWGERIFSCLDPFGYEWEFSHPLDSVPDDPTAAVHRNWFGA